MQISDIRRQLIDRRRHILEQREMTGESHLWKLTLTFGENCL